MNDWWPVTRRRRAQAIHWPYLKVSVQNRGKCEIHVLRKAELKVFWIGHLYQDWQVANIWNYHYYFDFEALFKYKTWIFNHVSLSNTFWRTMLSRLNTLLHLALYLVWDQPGPSRVWVKSCVFMKNDLNVKSSMPPCMACY